MHVSGCQTFCVSFGPGSGERLELVEDARDGEARIVSWSGSLFVQNAGMWPAHNQTHFDQAAT